MRPVTTTSTAKLLAWGLLFLNSVMSTISLALLALGGSVSVPEAWGFQGDSAFLGLFFAVPGMLLATRRPENPVGWLILGIP